MNAISLIKFLIKSQNQHGLHSPFAYDFTVKCLYKRNYVFDNGNYPKLAHLFAENPKHKIIPRILDYFDFKTILILGEKNEDLDYNGIKVHFRSLSKLNELSEQNNALYDIVFVESEFLNKIEELNSRFVSNLYSYLSEKSLIIIDKVHLLDNSIKSQLLSAAQRSLYLNSFYYGFVFKNADLSVQEINLRL
jgi:hypothetical protein